MKFSRRSSIHLTGRFNFTAAQGTKTSSGWSIIILGPKPPPMKGAITRTWCSDNPSIAAMPLRIGMGACVVSQTVNCWLFAGSPLTLVDPGPNWEETSIELDALFSDFDFQEIDLMIPYDLPRANCLGSGL